MKKCNSLTIAILMAVLAVFVLGTSFAIAGDTAKKVPGEEHRMLFPEGHGIPATGCYYDQEEDVYICSYEAPVKVDKDTKMMHKGGEPAYKIVPKAKHKAHESGLPCYFDEEEAVYFCTHAE